MKANVERPWARIHRRRKTAFFQTQTLCRFPSVDSRCTAWLSSRKQFKVRSLGDAFLSRPMSRGQIEDTVDWRAQGMGQSWVVQCIPAVINRLRGLPWSVHELYESVDACSYRDKMQFLAASLSNNRLDSPVDESVWCWMPAAMRELYHIANFDLVARQ